MIFAFFIFNMAKLILLRHLKSQWNLENKFTGWTDIPLSKEGVENAEKVAKKLINFEIDKIYTSPLMRNKNTASLILEELGKNHVPIVIDKALNERHYGKLQGQNKDEAKAEYGKEQVQLWRRSWDQAPPEGESLKDVVARVVPFYEEYIKRDIEQGKNILVVASHNSLRALVKHLEKIPEQEIINLEIATGEIKEYDFPVRS